jgi:dihydrofolate reductase
MIKAIVAMAENRVIGNAGVIPWHLPEDFKFFKATTMGHTILMGRKTYESIGKPLPGRENIVLSRTMPETPGVIVIRSLDELKEPSDGRDLFVIGGEEIYRLLLPRVQELYVTRVHSKVDGDTCFPEFMNDFDDGEMVLETPDFRTWRYKRIIDLKALSESSSLLARMQPRSRLTPEMEAARQKIGAINNRLVLIILIGFGVVNIASICILHKFFAKDLANNIHLGVLLFFVVLTIVGLCRLSAYWAYLCRKLGLVCPKCHQTLFYDPRITSGTLFRGKCPRCSEYIGVEGAEERSLFLSDWSR